MRWGLLGSLAGSSQSNSNQSFITSLLDADGDGSVIDDIAGMAMGNKKEDWVVCLEGFSERSKA
jgi:hypothetical protein